MTRGAAPAVDGTDSDVPDVVSTAGGGAVSGIFTAASDTVLAGIAPIDVAAVELRTGGENSLSAPFEFTLAFGADTLGLAVSIAPDLVVDAAAATAAVNVATSYARSREAHGRARLGGSTPWQACGESAPPSSLSLSSWQAMRHSTACVWGEVLASSIPKAAAAAAAAGVDVTAVAT